MSLLLIVILLLKGALALPTSPQSAQRQFIKTFDRGKTVPFSFQYDGVVSQQLLQRKAEISSPLPQENTRTITYTVHGSQLSIRCVLKAYADFPAVEWVLYLKNTGTADTPIIESIQALDYTVNAKNEHPVLHYSRGAAVLPEDFQPFQRVMNHGAKVYLHPGGGRSSSEYMPFFNLAQNAGDGVIGAVGWSGEWALQFSADYSFNTRLMAGLALTHLKLHPGEEIRSPRMVLLFYSGGWINGQNLFRRFVLRHHRPLANGQPFDLPTFCGNWGATPASDHLLNLQAIIDHDLPVDYYWIDAEWYGKGVWFKTTGDWRPKKELYPDGFKPISDLAHRHGRKFLLWFEPERVSPGTPWYQDYPNWLLSIPPEKKFASWEASFHDPSKVLWESRRNQINDYDRLFDLSNPEARKFLIEYISTRIEEWGIDCYRHDANMAPLDFWRAADAPDRQGISEIRWIEGLYEFWDGLLQRHPGLIIDNCASGGRRIDLEMMSRSTPFWRTDFPVGANVRQSQTYGISFWAPLNGTGYVSLAKDDDYALRSTFGASFQFEIFNNGMEAQKKIDFSAYPYDRMRKVLDLYKGIQKYYYGDFYPLTEYSTNDDSWMAWQFHRPDLNEGIVQVFRRPQSICETGRVTLQGLESGAQYSLFEVDTGIEQQLTGQKLLSEGLAVSLMQCPQALIVIYKKLTKPGGGL